MFHRTLESLINDPEIKDEMIILAGPRQVGKTTLAKKWLGSASALYFNWDDEKTRLAFRKDAHFFESRARASHSPAKIVFDEIHKIPRWKNVLKGYYDFFKDDFRFFVTGSARLDLLQRAGDSMLGRYHLLHLSPLTPHELARKPSGILETPTDPTALERPPLPQDAVETLLEFSGFPRMVQRQSRRGLNLWHREYRQRLIREDLRDLTRITDFMRMETLFELLPHRVGSPLSLNSLREDLACSHAAVKNMVDAFQKLYVILKIPPFGKKIKYALNKEPKVYFYDWTLVGDEGARFENFIAVQLKAYCDFASDGGWANMDLHYVRDKQKREVDFLITKDKRPVLLVEAKISGNNDTRSVEHFASQTAAPLSVIVTREPGIFKKLKNGVWEVSANRFMNLLWR